MGIDGAEIKKNREKAAAKNNDNGYPHLNKKIKTIIDIIKYRFNAIPDKIINSIVIAISLVFCIYWYMDTPKLPKKTSIQYPILMSEKIIKSYLKSPSSAKFGLGRTGAARLGNNEYYVRGAVDSQNGFGAMIRTQWEIQIKQVCDDVFDRECWRVTKEPTFSQ